jgi:hypothetical protein
MNLRNVERSDRVPRHEHRVQKFSRDYELITDVGDGYAVERDEATSLVISVTERFAVPVPALAFNQRRRPDTGQCWAPKWHAVETNGADRIAAWETHYRRTYPEHGQIRIGATTTLRTIAHELGHHLVHHIEPVRTPAHGKVWVGRFDDAMETIVEQI